MGTVRGFGLNFTAMSAEVAEQPSGPPARQVVYCGVCSLPPEYCEFGGTVKKCEEWLLKHHPDMHQKLYSAEALSANLSALSVEAQKRAEKYAAKKTAKAEAAEQREAERKAEVVPDQTGRAEQEKICHGGLGPGGAWA